MDPKELFMIGEKYVIPSIVGMGINPDDHGWNHPLQGMISMLPFTFAPEFCVLIDSYKRVI